MTPAAVNGGPGAGGDRRPPSGDGALAGVSVLVPRSAGQAAELSERLRALGAEPVEAPTISIEPPRDPQALADALERTAEGVYDWLAFTSPNAVDAVLAGRQSVDLAAARVAAVGGGTQRALEAHGWTPDLVPRRSTARGLAEELVAGGSAGRVLLPRADIASAGLPRALEDAGWQVDEVEAYRTVPVRDLPAGVAADLREGRIDVIAVTSGSTVRNLLALLEGRPHQRVRVVTIGPATTGACEEMGLPVAVEADPHDLDGLVAAVVAAVDS